ncbi:MAG: hypothetical protein WCQ95_08785 [Bacteroidota bacterium]
MKHLKFVFIVMLLMSVNTFSQKNETANKWLVSGTKLTYHIVNITNEYDFLISNLLIDKDVSFKWMMSDPINYSGEIKMTRDALDTASTIVNYFADKSVQHFTDKSSGWLSKKLYRSLKNNTGAKIIIDKKPETITFKQNEKYTVIVDGVDVLLDVMYAETASGFKFWILDDAKNPLIVKMQLAFTLELKKIDTK